jgi:carboxymethylenebutenolidase
LTIASCVKVPGIKAGVCFYGIPPVQLADPAKLTVPMQFHFADKDQSAGFADIKVATTYQGL